MNPSHLMTASLPQIVASAGPEDTALLIADERVLTQRLNLLTQAFPAGTSTRGSNQNEPPQANAGNDPVLRIRS